MQKREFHIRESGFVYAVPVRLIEIGFCLMLQTARSDLFSRGNARAGRSIVQDWIELQANNRTESSLYRTRLNRAILQSG